MSIAPTSPPSSPMAVSSSPSMLGRFSMVQRIVMLSLGLV
jgi:hypothetical protein